jgi:ABC-2 type transport system ATP-binding protein
LLSEPIIAVKRISKSFSGKRVLKDVSFEVNRSETYALLGLNGAGKTTLINILLGIMRPDGGEVLIKGSSPLEPRTRKAIGFCPQEPSLLGRLTGLENIKLFAGLYGVRFNEVKDRVYYLLKELDLIEHVGKLVDKYSGGMKKKLSLVIALMHDPEVLVLDELATGMDPLSRRKVWDILKESKKEGKTILLSTHYMEETERLADRVGIMYGGKLLVEGSPDELKRRYGPKTVIELKVRAGDPKRVVNVLRGEGLKALGRDSVVRVFVDNPEVAVPRVVSLVHSIGGLVGQLRVTKPTLEDVFVKLTGRGQKP